MNVAPVQLGGTIQIPLLTVNTADVPTDSAVTPTMDIYSDIGKAAILSGISFTNKDTGLYYANVECSGAKGFAAGMNYTCYVSYSVSTALKQVIQFQVI